MAQVISQNLTVPAGLADGSTATAGQILPLYAALNNFVLPDGVSGFIMPTVDDTGHILTIGGTVTKDWTVNIPQLRSVLFMIPFTYASVTGSEAGRITYRVNGAAVTNPAFGQLSTAVSGAGIVVGFIGPRSAGMVNGFVVLQTDGGTFKVVATSSDLPAADIASIGVTFTVTAGSTGTITFKHARFWREG
jgi:hypothetical protein